MTTEEFSRMIAAAQNGDTKPFDAFFKMFSRECKSRLYHFVDSKVDAEEAFSEAMYKFWKSFVIEKRALPKSNVKGYIFTMAKFYCLDRQKQKSKEKEVLTDDMEQQVKKNVELVVTDKTEQDFLEEQHLEDKYQEVLRSSIRKLKEKCQRIFEFIKKNDIDKPGELWKPLGYKNAATVRTVKAECMKALKLRVVVEMNKLLREE